MSLTEILIRPANITDVPAIEQCAVLAYTKYIERMELEPAPMHADFAMLVKGNDVSIASTDNGFAGFVVFYVRDDHMHLENIAVLPELTGQGIGSKLISHVEHQANMQAITKVELYTNEAMHENFGLYKHLGYAEVDRQEQDGFNRVFFSKNL